MTGGSIPDQYAELYQEHRLCQMYHCLPSELDDEDWFRLYGHLVMDGAIESWREREAQAARARAR